jgi:LEA14-like dessication related protein
MKLPDWFPILLLFMGGLMTSCAPLRPIEFRSVTDFKVQHLTSSPELAVNLNLHNPNSFGGKVKEFDIDFFLGESKITSVALKDVRVPSGSDFTLPLSTTASYQQLIQFLPSGISSLKSGKDIPLRLSGKVTLKKFLFRKTLPFEFHSTVNTKDIELK